MNQRILVIGANGQIGSDLTIRLNDIYGIDNVFLSDIKNNNIKVDNIYENINVLDYNSLEDICLRHNINIVYNLAALLSGDSEKKPQLAWDINMNGLFNTLELAKNKIVKKIFWPSSIAVFGTNTPKIDTRQNTICDPISIYGISKLAGERWCDYYRTNFQVDVRSIRYPGLLSYKTIPHGGTTDYAVHMILAAKRNENYTCYLSEQTFLPMLYMDDAINMTIKLMNEKTENLKCYNSYNIPSISFTPIQLYNELLKIFPSFKCEFLPDYRQTIADSWPKSIDASISINEWGASKSYDLNKMINILIENL